MLRIPRKVKTGEPVKARDHNALIDYVRSITLQVGTGYRLNRSAGGTTMNITPSKRGDSAAGGCVPWTPKYTNKGTVETPNWVVELEIGTVGGVVPSNWDAEFPVTYDTRYYAVLDVVATGTAQVTSAALSLVTTLPSGADLDPTNKGSAPTSKKAILGTMKSGKYCMVFNNALEARVVEKLRIPLTIAPSPGLEPFERWYGWEITEGGS